MKRLATMCGAALLLAVCAGGSGCVLVRKGAAKVVSPMAMELSEGFMHQNDVDLVREGAPAFLLMLDALAEAHPDKPAVLIAAAEAQMAYAMGFVDQSQKERSKTMFLKAKTYGLRALSRNRRFARALSGSHDDFVQALSSFRKKDAGALLSTATSWVMWIIASSDSPAALGDMPKVLEMMKRVQALDPGIRKEMHALLLQLWGETRMTVFMVTHDLSEGFNLGTRLLVFDKVRLDPQAPNAYGARITYDIPLNETRLSSLSGTAPDNVYALRG